MRNVQLESRLLWAATWLLIGACAQPAAADDKQFTDLSSEAYQRAFEEWTPQGYRPVAVRVRVRGNRERYDVTLRHFNDGRYWVSKHGITDAEFKRLQQEYEAAGLALTVHETFRLGRTTYHVAVWEAVGRPAREIWIDQPMPASGRTAPELARLDELLQTFIREDQLPGATVAVARRGKLVYARGFGYSDVEREEPMQPDALLRIASISKPITAVAILQLVERGSLGLSDPVFDIVNSQPHPPDAQLDPRLASITIQQLLQHTGGWDSNQSSDPMFQSSSISQALGVDPPARPAEIISYMLGRPLDFDPGTRYGYSNFGYCLLGRVIEAVSGQSYEDHVRQSVLLPLGIERMQLGKTPLADRAEGEVRYYTPDDATGPSVVGEIGEPVPLPYGAWSLESMDAHAGWIASAIDLVRFASALDDPRQSPLLSESSVRTMFAPPEYVDAQAGSYYGCGWQVRLVGPPGSFNATHVGSLDGTSTILVRRHGGLDWAVLFNSRGKAGDAAPAAKVEGLMHRALSAVRAWPQGDLFREFE